MFVCTAKAYKTLNNSYVIIQITIKIDSAAVVELFYYETAEGMDMLLFQDIVKRVDYDCRHDQLNKHQTIVNNYKLLLE